jgi:hypothetical protein
MTPREIVGGSVLAVSWPWARQAFFIGLSALIAETAQAHLWVLPGPPDDRMTTEFATVRASEDQRCSRIIIPQDASEWSYVERPCVLRTMRSRHL